METNNNRNVSIIIPVFNRKELTLQCLNSLNKTEFKNEIEVIVVDNNSTDGTFEEITGLQKSLNYNLTIIRNTTNLGFAKANNIGTKKARYENLLFLNNDTIIQQDFISKPLEVLNTNGIGAVGIKLLYPDNLIQHAGLAFDKNKLATHIYNFYKSDFPLANISREVSAVTGACFFIKKKLYEQLGGFDEIYINGQEDIDLCMKIKNSGLKIWYVPEAWIYHLESQSANRLEKAFQNKKIFLSRWENKIVPDLDSYYKKEINKQTLLKAVKTKFDLSGKINFAIKIGVPDREHKNWGDIFFANSLSDSLKKNGHNSVIHYLNEWNQSDKNIDVVIHIKGLSKYELKEHNINIIWIINHPELHTAEELNNYDLVFVASKKYFNQIKENITVPVYYLPQATDQNYFNNTTAKEKEYDILFVGNNYEAKNNKCRKIIRDLLEAETNYDFKIVGENWEKFVNTQNILARFVEWKDLPQLYSKAKIVLNDHQKTMRENGFINNRTFDIAQTNTMQISNNVEGMDEYGIEVYDSVTELKEKIEKYLGKEELRKQKAEENFERTKECTFDKRAETIIAKIKELLTDSKLQKKINNNNVENGFEEKINLSNNNKLLNPASNKNSETVNTNFESVPTVAVLMTTFNRRETLADAIQSIIDQTYKNWNLILINDGGEDVADIVALFNDSRIKYFSIENKGKPAALNFAIKNSDSKYVAYLDDDDKYLPNHLEVLVTYLETHKKYSFVYSIAEEVSLVNNNHRWFEYDRKIHYAKQVNSSMLLKMNHIPNLCAVHSRELFTLSGMYDESLEVLIDWDMYRRLSLVSEPKFINVVTAEYFRRKGLNNNAENQITGMFFNDPVNYYKNRLKITSKEHKLKKILNENCIIIEINDSNKNDAKFFVAKYKNFQKHIDADLLYVINCTLDKNLLESIMYAERVGGLVVWNFEELNQKELISKLIKNSNCKNHLYFDTLKDYNLENQKNAFKAEQKFIHFSKKLRKIYPEEFFKNKQKDKHSAKLPGVSIIIPTYNNWRLTEKCLTAVYKSKTKVEFEIIIVDNNSTDKTVTELNKYVKKHKNLSVILNEENLGFAKANNIGVKNSKNELILFLNNDTEPHDYWLDEMIKVLNKEKNIGIVGAKLLYPGNNLIQHAGVVINNEPHKITPFHIFHNKPQDYIKANFVREYQAVTGACLLIKKDLFEEVNMFDERFINGYEDMDLCFKVREKGYKILYAPKAVVIHHESKSAGRFDYAMHNVKLLHQIWENKINKDDFMQMFKPQVSIVIPVYNQLNYTKKCIRSIKENTNVSYELIIINNASTDGTKEYLLQQEDIVVINNTENLGYPKAINQGILKAKGEDIVLLNNDTIVTEGWLQRLLKIKSSDSLIGIVGVYSNSISGFQLDLDAKYNSIKEMHQYAKKNYTTREYAWIKYPRVAFVCVLINGKTIDEIGGLDERFTPGNFEDDDFCLRAQLAGFKTVVGTDVFIHHFGSVSFKSNGNNEYQKRLEINKQKFIEKWGASPEELWLDGKPPLNRKLKIPIHEDLFNQSIARAFINIDDEEYNYAIENLKTALNNYENSNRGNYENITKEEILNLLGTLLLSVKDLEGAKEYFELELNENPNSSAACFGLGEVFYQAEMFNESKTMLEWAIVNDKENHNARLRLQQVNTKLNLPTEHNTVLMETDKEEI